MVIAGISPNSTFLLKEGQQFCSPINERVSPSKNSERSDGTMDTLSSQESAERDGEFDDDELFLFPICHSVLWHPALG